jgi:hypothetical protein
MGRAESAGCQQLVINAPRDSLYVKRSITGAVGYDGTGAQFLTAARET